MKSLTTDRPPIKYFKRASFRFKHVSRIITEMHIEGAHIARTNKSMLFLAGVETTCNVRTERIQNCKTCKGVKNRKRPTQNTHWKT